MRNPTTHLAILARVALAFAVAGATVAPAMAQSGDVPKVEFEKHVLPNGLQLLLHVDRKLPIVHVNQWFHVGSKTSTPKQSPLLPGSSHTALYIESFSAGAAERFCAPLDAL